MTNELTITGLVLILKRRSRIITISIAACFLVAATVLILNKPRYEGVGVIEIQKSATDGLGLENLAGAAEEQSDALDATITLQTQANILQSTSLALKVITDLKLDQTEDFKSTFNPISWVMGLLSPAGPVDPLNASLEDSPHRSEHAVNIFEKRLKVKPFPGTRLIEVRYRSSDPRTAAAVVNEVAKSLVDYTLNSRFAATSQVSTWLSGQLGDIKKEAETLQGKVERLQRESGVYSLGLSDAQGKEIAYSSTLDRLQQATQALSAATSSRIMKGGLYKTVQDGDPELISGLAGSSLAGASGAINTSFTLLQSLRAQQTTLSSQYASDVSKYGTANPRLLDEKASLDSIDKEISSEVSRIGKRAENDYRASQVVESNLHEIYDRERTAADSLNDKAIGLIIARQEASDARVLYQTLYSHLKEAGVIGGLRSSNISIVDAGRIPSKPLPDIPIYLGLSLVCGSIFGVTGAMLAEVTDEKLMAMASIEDSLHTRILAVLPLIQAGVQRRRLAVKFRRQLASGSQEKSSATTAVIEGPNTAYVEALRGLRTSLLLTSGDKPPKTILVTSAAEQEGKSTLSLNLAAVLALNGSRVLLVDCDLRSAGLSGYLGFERMNLGFSKTGPPGLSDALSSSNTLGIITPFEGLPRLSALPAGQGLANPSELLGSMRMASLVESWEQAYDYIVLDSPPVLAVTDALVIARLADKTLLVARHKASKQKSLDRAYQVLNQVGSTSVSIVVNGVRRDSVSFDEFYGYSGNSYYSEA